MANRTVKDAHTIHGTNPQYLVEKIIRTRIYDSKYWKEQCFALTAELMVDKAMDLRYIGGTYAATVKPSPFLCLTLKMLQIQPEKDIVIEFIKQDDFKYVRALGAFYLRLVYSSLDCYKYLEPLLNDYRKLRIMNRNGKYELSHMDVFIDQLLREDRVNDIGLPRIQKRWVHENGNELEARISLLDEDLDLESESEDEDMPSSPPLNSHHRRRDDERYLRDDKMRGRSPVERNDREREKRHRDQREHKRRRSRSRERRHRSPGRHQGPKKHRDREHERERPRREDRENKRERRRVREEGGDREKRRHKRERESSLDTEIAEANHLRAKLGMAPLKR